MSTAAKQAAQKRETLREQYWPGSSNRIFPVNSKNAKGYARVPRVVPLVAALVNDLGGKLNAGSLYQVLWAQDWGEGVIEIKSYKRLLYEAGYSGANSRAHRTWQERLKVLTRHGFVETAKDRFDEHGCLLLVDPYLAVVKLEHDRAGLSKDDGKKFDRWFEYFKEFSLHWGIDLDAHRKRLWGEGTSDSDASETDGTSEAEASEPDGTGETEASEPNAEVQP